MACSGTQWTTNDRTNVKSNVSTFLEFTLTFQDSVFESLNDLSDDIDFLYVIDET